MAAKSYPVIGGPLNGMHLSSEDFREATYVYDWRGSTSFTGAAMVKTNTILKPQGRFYNERELYVPFNRSGNGPMSNSRNRDGKFVPSMIWLARSLLP